MVRVPKSLLDAARGLRNGESVSCLKCFALKKDQIRVSLDDPTTFHRQLCKKIRGARTRLYLASLYIGPAANPSVAPKEKELLDALSETKASTIKIILDESRALRQIPVSASQTSTSSAHACWQATERSSEIGRQKIDLRLFPVLSPTQKQLFPNPFNEVAGVFHIKCYIFDNEMVLTGANLSEEYFSNRSDRYLWIKGHDNRKQSIDLDPSAKCLVNMYADLIDALSDHSNSFKESESDSRTPSSKEELSKRLGEILMEDEPEAIMNQDEDNDVVAYAIPTFQAPMRFFGHCEDASDLPSDMDVTIALLRAAAEEPSDIRLASAYLNLTDTMSKTLQMAKSVHLLTAGSISHGFKPNPKKVGNKGTMWIPACFDFLTRNAVLDNRNAHLWYFQRQDWTFHAKGLWVSSSQSDGSVAPALPSQPLLRAVTHGSGNYGYRSSLRDMESNLILLLPEQSPLQNRFREEWNSWMTFSRPGLQETPQELPFYVRMVLPIIRRFL